MSINNEVEALLAQVDVPEEWAAWSTPILDYLSRALAREASIVVDANKEEEDTVQIAENIMPRRCRFQELRAADLIFRREDFSLESGYWDDDGNEFVSPYDEAYTYYQECKALSRPSSTTTPSEYRRLRRRRRPLEEYEKPLVIKMSARDWSKLRHDLDLDSKDES
ncbi:hypothetical protein QBC46DRAFT_337602, partial [Diplogelasinospora grovesii]